ncbi:hypothetical protein JCM10914_312 [Paenibacillus sp. JCM 10914]|nr:hypothetical protein JCM10914_312 [Paenibacillus sp. JCM 10914]
MEPFVNRRQPGPSLLMLESWQQVQHHNRTLTAGFTGRQGGISQGPYHGLNLPFTLATIQSMWWRIGD